MPLCSPRTFFVPEKGTQIPCPDSKNSVKTWKKRVYSSDSLVKRRGFQASIAALVAPPRDAPQKINQVFLVWNGIGYSLLPKSKPQKKVYTFEALIIYYTTSDHFFNKNTLPRALSLTILDPIRFFQFSEPQRDWPVNVTKNKNDGPRKSVWKYRAPNRNDGRKWTLPSQA